MTFYRTDGHVQCFRYFRGVEVFLITQQDDHSCFFGQCFHQLSYALAQQEIRLRILTGRLGNVVEPYTRAQFPFSYFVDGTMTDRAAQPPRGVRGTLDTSDLPVELQEYVLREFLRAFAITQEAKGDAEDHRLVVRQHFGEFKTHTRYYGRAGPEIASSVQIS